MSLWTGEYTLKEALDLARLWRAGKLIGGDEMEVIGALLAGYEGAVSTLRAVDDFYWPPDPDIPGESEIMAEVHALVAGSASGKEVSNGN